MADKSLAPEKFCNSCQTTYTANGAKGSYCTVACALQADPMPWSEELAYITGLMASDGCLVYDKRNGSCSLEFVSIEREMINTMSGLLKRLDVEHSAETRGFTSSGNQAYRVRWTHYAMWNTFIKMGLMPKKSLVMKELRLPKDAHGYNHFWLFFRGVFEGDGSVLLHPTSKIPTCARIAGGAPIFMLWLRKELWNRGIYGSSIIKLDKQGTQALVINGGYIPKLYWNSYLNCPSWVTLLGFGEKKRRLSLRATNIETRPYIVKQRLTEPKILKAFATCQAILGRMPNTEEYARIRKLVIGQLDTPSNFPSLTPITKRYGTWQNVLKKVQENLSEQGALPYVIELNQQQINTIEMRSSFLQQK
jgi:hypothetical protein